MRAYSAAVIAFVLEPICQRKAGSRTAPSSPCEMMPDTLSFGHVRPTAPLGVTPDARTALDKAAPATPIRKLRLLKMARRYRTRIFGGILNQSF
jgi:hypothetical protein